MYDNLININHKPKAFEFYTASTLWNDEYTSEQMLKYHLNEDVDMSSRNKKFINTSVDWIASKFNIGTGTKICDFGCGPGLYTTKFAETGASVTGLDFSKRSINYAKETAAKKSLIVDYQLQNYLDYSSDKKFDLITMIMCDFCALSPVQRLGLLNVFNQHLHDDGALLFDVYSEAAFSQREESSGYEHLQLNSFWSPNDYYGFLNSFKYNDEKVMLDKYTIIEKFRTFEVYNWLQYFSMKALKDELQKGGFTISEISSDIAGKKYDSDSLEFAVIARKM
jgi:SAM-dependent methyltransferase